MWEYLAVLLIGFWLGVAIFLYVSCYWIEEIFDLPPRAEAASPPSASGAHAQLKRLVARVVDEASALPALARYAAEPSRTTPVEASTYEDLLATAILNKVIERYQNENGSGGRSSGIHSASASPTPSERSSPRSLTSRHIRDITPPLREVDEDELSDWEEGNTTDDALEMPKRVPFPEFGGDIINRTSSNEERDFDEVSGSEIQTVDGTWEENWLFQKKKIKTIQSVPVPMLVPNSNAEYRALIGDRDADDTTDLSDNASDAEDGEFEYKSNIKKVLDSKHIIGGHSEFDAILDFEPDSLTIIETVNDFEKVNDNKLTESNLIDASNDKVIQNTSINNKLDNNLENARDDSILVVSVDSGPLTKTEFSLKEEIHRTALNGRDYSEDLNTANNDEHDVTDSHTHNKSTTNTITSRHEREGEYEETVTVPVQRYADSLRRKHFEEEPQQVPTRDTDQDDDLIPGSIAYRERKKWLNYVEMPNNPYSPEAIQKRLNAKNASSVFDMICNKGKDLEDNENTRDRAVTKEIPDRTEDELPVKDVSNKKSFLSIDLNSAKTNGSNELRDESPSPRILKDVLAEEIPQYKRYGRDYYIKEAKSACGGRKKNSFSDTSSVSSMHKSTSLDNFDSELASPGLLIKQINTIATNQHYMKFTDKTADVNQTPWKGKTEILIEYEDVSEQTLFSAEPVLIDDETDKRINEILQVAYNSEVQFETKENHINDEQPKSPTDGESFLSSSSLDDSVKVYNVQTGTIVRSDDNLSLRYESTPDRDGCNVIDNAISADIVEVISYGDTPEDSLRIELIEKENSETESAIAEEEEVINHLPSVKELAKKFVSMDSLNGMSKVDFSPQEGVLKRRQSIEDLISEKSDKPTNKQAYMHSLTARSISREFREGLKMSMATPLKIPGGTKQSPDGANEIISESTEFEEPLPEPGTIKSKLAFFESLRSKVSRK